MRMHFDEHVFSHSQYVYIDIVYTLPRKVGKRSFVPNLAKKGGLSARNSYKTMIKNPKKLLARRKCFPKK